MSENRTSRQKGQEPAVRFGARFWDAVEFEIEVLDAADFALFLAADQLGCEPRPGAAESIGASLAALCRARFSN